jgi:hypothetical protein
LRNSASGPGRAGFGIIEGTIVVALGPQELF